MSRVRATPNKLPAVSQPGARSANANAATRRDVAIKILLPDDFTVNCITQYVMCMLRYITLNTLNTTHIALIKSMRLCRALLEAICSHFVYGTTRSR